MYQPQAGGYGFYDLKEDLMELSGLIRSGYQEQVQAMRKRLLRFYMETGDTMPARKAPG